MYAEEGFYNNYRTRALKHKNVMQNILELMEIFLKYTWRIIMVVVPHNTDSQEDKLVINENTEEESLWGATL